MIIKQNDNMSFLNESIVLPDKAVLSDKKDYTCFIKLFDSVWTEDALSRDKISRIRHSLVNLYCNQSHAEIKEFVANDDMAKNIIDEIHKIIFNDDNDVDGYADARRVSHIQNILCKFGREIASL